MSPGDFRIVAAGDAMLLVEFAERIDPAVNARAIALADALRALTFPGVRDIIPAYRSVGVAFDPLATRVDDLRGHIHQLAAAASVVDENPRAPLEVPVRYGGDEGPDLDAVAAFAGLPPGDVVALHTSTVYRVYMLGFMPGFAYMGAVPARIAMPRRASPRLTVTQGSVGIAGNQTGIYPIDTPGGWQIIGRTDLLPFDRTRPEPCFFKAGDMVRFRAVTAS